MTAFDYASLQAEIGEVIAELGFAATLTRPSAESDEPQTPWDDAASPANDPVPYVMTVVDTGIRDFFAPGGLLTRRARVLIVASGVVVPLKADVITVGGVDHVIAEVQRTAPGGTDLVYEVELVG